MSKPDKRIVILTEDELKKTISRLTFEIIIGETQTKRDFDIVFEKGLPKLSEFQKEEEVVRWNNKPLIIRLKDGCNIGEDNLKLYFRIAEDSSLHIRCEDINKKELGEFNLGNIF